MRHKLKSLFNNERGSQLIEFVAIFPMIIMAALLIWQMALVAYTVVVAEASARDGARVASVEGNYQQAVQNSAQGLNVTASKSVSGDSLTVTVIADVPTISIPFVGRIEYQLDADATMPLEDELDS